MSTRWPHGVSVFGKSRRMDEMGKWGIELRAYLHLQPKLYGKHLCGRLDQPHPSE